MNLNISISEVTQPDVLLLDSINSLLSSLSPNAPAITNDVLRELIEDPATRLLLATINTPSAKEGSSESEVVGGEGSSESDTVDKGKVTSKDRKKIVGMLTLAVFRIPSGVRAWIEDVVVDTEMRGNGIGAALVRRAIEIAQESKAKTVDLTSRPSREAANRLYQRLGFEQRSTNVYRYTVENDAPPYRDQRN